MAVQKLTDQKIRGAKAKDKVYRLSDGGGLVLAIMPSGSKKWQLRYMRGARPTMTTLGSYPELGLSKARSQAEKIRGDI